MGDFNLSDIFKMLEVFGIIVGAIILTYLGVRDVSENGCYADSYFGNKDKDGNYKPADDKINPGKLE